MQCIFCSNETKVVDSRYIAENNAVRRRRQCLNCQKRFNTFEKIECVDVLVVKSDGTRQSFNSNKIKQGIIKACEKLPVTISQIDAIVQDIEQEIQNSLKQEISSCDIGEMVVEKLKNIDHIAYIRFASVYKQFTEINDFESLINEFDKLVKPSKK